MSGSNRLRYIAFGIALALASPVLGQTQNQEDVEATNQQPEAAPKQQEIAPAPVVPPPPAESESPAVYQPDCESPKTRDEADLCEQRRMAEAAIETADWAQETVKWAERQFYATVGEIIALVTTIAIAILAVAAAFGSNRIARETAERPFFVVTKLNRQTKSRGLLPLPKNLEGREVLNVEAAAHNYGTRVGIIRSAHFAYGWQPPPQKMPPIDTLGEWAGQHTVEPSEGSPPFRHTFVLTADKWETIRQHDGDLCVYGYIRYSDVRGITWRAGFSFTYNPPLGSEDPGSFARSGPRNYWFDIEEKNEAN